MKFTNEHIKHILSIDEEKGLMLAESFSGRILTYKITYIPTDDGTEESIKECEELKKYYEVE